ncbi:MAG TPA: Gfo/Idh/MocA family oxidoreductase [Gemmataceae bacterium]|nr:Gfo/Idh/MocA family oxidoreductase [Gemmataceae bacterium]
MSQRLGVGIIGLGRTWRRRYAPALRALADRFAVAAVCDQVARVAASEAARLRCPVAAGPSDLIERDDVAAVLLLDLGWQRLWPVGRAARAGKPVFCLHGPEDDPDHADELVRRVREAGAPVMVAAPAAFGPAALRLRELPRERLGPVRLVLCESAADGPAAPHSATLAWLFSLLGKGGATVGGTGGEFAGLLTLTVEADAGRALHLAHWHAPGSRPGLSVRLVGERGQALLASPRRLSWDEPDGRHVLTLPRGRPVEERMLTAFHGVATSGEAPRPSLEDASRAYACLRAVAP